MSGLANFRKTTRHYTHLSLCLKSRKTNDAKSRKWPKASIWAIFWRVRGHTSPNCNFILKNRFHSNWRPYLVQTSGQKTKNIVRAVFEKNISVWFWANLETFLEISPNQEFFSKIRLCDISTFKQDVLGGERRI